MPYDRRSRRALLALVGLVGVAVSVGCARSSNLRTAAGSLPDLAPAGALHADTEVATTSPGGSSTNPLTSAGSAMTSSNSTAPASQPATASSPIPGGTDPLAGPAMTRSTPSAAPTTGNPSADGDGGPAVEPAQPAGSGPGAGTSTTPAPDGASPGPAGATTPLLDAELRRARAITRQHFESLNAITRPSPGSSPGNTPAASTRPTLLEPTPVESDPDLLAPLPPLAASAAPVVKIDAPSPTIAKTSLPTLMPVETTASGMPSADPVPLATEPSQPATGSERPLDQPKPAEVPIAAAPTRTPGTEETSRPAKASGPAGAADPAGSERPSEVVRTADALPAEPAPAGERPPAIPNPPPDATPSNPEGRPPLEITELKLCTRVRKFGEYDAIDHERVPTGRVIIVYCEMAGLEYQPRGDVLVSRLSTHLELCSRPDGPVVWEQSPGTAEDTCRRSRRDYFVSYFIELPRSLEPGSYRLRVIQTDLIGNRVKTREIPITVIRPG